jgi:hypothetical protein
VDIWCEIFLKKEYKEYSKNIYSYHLKILGVDEEYKEYSPSKKKKNTQKIFIVTTYFHLKNTIVGGHLV